MASESSLSTLPRIGIAALLAGLEIPGEIQLPNGSVVAVGGVGEPAYRVLFCSTRALRTPMTDLGVARAFVSGEIQVEGDIGILFGARQKLRDKVPCQQKMHLLYDCMRTTIR